MKRLRKIHCRRPLSVSESKSKSAQAEEEDGWGTLLFARSESRQSISRTTNIIQVYISKPRYVLSRFVYWTRTESRESRPKDCWDNPGILNITRSLLSSNNLVRIRARTTHVCRGCACVCGLKFSSPKLQNFLEKSRTASTRIRVVDDGKSMMINPDERSRRRASKNAVHPLDDLFLCRGAPYRRMRRCEAYR